MEREKRVKMRVRMPRLRASGHFKMCQATLARVTIVALPFRPNVK